MPIHQNQDGTWQWGKSGKKYKKKQDAIKQMKAIFANGYVEKHATLNGNAYNDINNKGSLYMTYKDVYNMIKQAAEPGSLQDKKVDKELEASKPAPQSLSRFITSRGIEPSPVNLPAKNLVDPNKVPAYAGGNMYPEAPGTFKVPKGFSVWKLHKMFGTVPWPEYLKGFRANHGGRDQLKQGEVVHTGPF